jgi:acyl carrier protein
VTRDEARAAVVRILGDIAPEMDPATLAFDVDLRDQLDIDSMDFLTFVIAVHEQTGVDIPERDYPKLATLDQIVDYVAAGASG